MRKRSKFITEALRQSPGLSWTLYSFVVGYTLQGLYFVVVARELRASQFGLFAGALAIPSVFAPFSAVGAGSLLLMVCSREPKAHPAYFGNALIWTIGSALVLGPAIVSGIHWLSPKFSTVVLPLVASELVFGKIVEICAQAFQARGRLNYSAQFPVGLSLCRLLAILPFTLVKHHDAVTWAFCYCVASACVGTTAFVITCRILGGPVFVKGILLSGPRRGLPFAVGQSAKTVYADVDKYFLANLFSVSVAGVYTAAYRIVDMAFSPARALIFSNNRALFRAGSQGSWALRHLFNRLLPAELALSVVGCLAVAGSGVFVPALLGPSYGDVKSMLFWLSALPLLQGLHYLVGDTLMGAGKQSYRSVTQLISALLNVMLNLAFVERYGWQAATLASYAAEAMLLLLTGRALRRHFQAEKEKAS